MSSDFLQKHQWFLKANFLYFQSLQRGIRYPWLLYFVYILNKLINHWPVLLHSLYNMTMGTSIRLHKKPIIFLILLSLCFTIWMSYGRTKKTSLSGYSRSEGLKAEGPSFMLNGKPFTILSGAMHYFRIVPQYWEDRLLKLKAMGLNTVET